MNDPYPTIDQPQVEPRSAGPTEPLPSHIGRFRIERILGRGGFGLVYLAHDDQLLRFVAIKVPHARLVEKTTDAEAYLTEARTVANLDHPNIVPVFDVGGTDQFPCYIISKYIDGTDLATRLKQSHLALPEAVALVATVAEALHHAHKQGLVHRDIKPGNILLDKSGKPFVADFGLALREQDVGQGPRFAGTPAYMSPEQARGEGHRVDGRSDIFSLGVVFYELLVGRRPFLADSQDELLEQITSLEARPPRQLDDTIPKELERICLKALSKRSSERCTTAKDMADDLRHFLASASPAEMSLVTGRTNREANVATPVPSLVPTPVDAQPVKIVPKGLRSFDATDADFFLELLPGPRDRDGLPESLRFWKARIEAKDADNTFAAGLIYGPSGCGKSSLVRAGLLPRLAKWVTAVYIEATAEETEARLLKGLRRQVADLPRNLGPTEALAALRQGRFLQAGQKVLLVLDQFEQWLHANRKEENTELVQALRQCDGGRLQCIVLVRDDFWLAVSRFMQALEVRILEGENARLVDLFDLLHARKVLAAFGQAHGRLPDNLGQCSKEQNAFLDQGVSGLSQEDKVISVRLALFAEMVKGRPWAPATLKEVGGIEGVGVTFLEDTFSSRTASPQHRLHQKAAQAVLKSLLPEGGTDIKGHMRSQPELLEASGYVQHPMDFEELLRILDSELRLLTPTDPEGVEGEGWRVKGEEKPLSFPSTLHPPPSTRYYQLTHDYLVPSLRNWLTRKQMETRRGRAELLLANRAAVWSARPENRQLPSLLQWLQIRWFTLKKNWTPPQRKMMRKAGQYHGVRGLVVALLLALVTFAGLTMQEQFEERRKATVAAELVQSLRHADAAQVPRVICEMAEYRHWTDPLLRDEYDRAALNSQVKLHASLALLPVDPGQVAYLYGRLLEAQPQQVPVLRDALAPHQDALREKLWAVVLTPQKDKEAQRLRAAAALAKYDPESERWSKAGALVVQDFVLENPVFLGQWSEAFRPVKNSLLVPLGDIFRDSQAERTAERSVATNLLADYAADNPPVLANLLMDADKQQFAVIYAKLQEHGEQGRPLLTGEIDKQLPADLAAADKQREKLAKRQANAAVALLRMNQPARVWPLLRFDPKQNSDPRLRSYLIHRLGPQGADAGAIVQRLQEESDVTIRRALILSLGAFEEKQLPSSDRQALLPKLQETYRSAGDAGLHAASEWLLRKWEQEEWLNQVNGAWARSEEHQQKRLAAIQQSLATVKENPLPQWYVNSQGQTMVVIPGPVEFLMGSPPTEVDRFADEIQHKKRIGRTFAIAASPVTVEQYRRFGPTYQFTERFAPTPNCPVVSTSWHEAAAYCNWLSEQENLAKVYEVDEKGRVLKMKKECLSLSGYRLPTEAEMEYACRAGAATSRYFGESEELLGKYAWCLTNSGDRSWPIGGKKPNDFGFFDMHGNVWCWCQERYMPYPKSESGRVWEDNEDELVINNRESRVSRGGSFRYMASSVRSANRNDPVPGTRNSAFGFRVARTLPLGPLTAPPPFPKGGRK